MRFVRKHGLKFKPSESKSEVFDKVKGLTKDLNLEIIEAIDKPWGWSFRFDSKDIDQFLADFFPGVKIGELGQGEKSPKFLVLSPNAQFSWQVHRRRKEIWSVMVGPMGVFLNTTDEIPDEADLIQEGESVMVENEVRHRLKALDNWGMVAEIWVHTDPQNPTDEDDIRRIHDDYNR